MRARLAILGTAVLLLSGCAGQVSDVTQTPQPSSSEPSIRPPFQSMPPMNPSGSNADLGADRLAAITADLAQRGVSGEIQVISSQATTWNDSSLGCPKPGMVYSQVLTPGFRAVVAVNGKHYDYRFGSTGSPKLCVKK